MSKPLTSDKAFKSYESLKFFKADDISILAISVEKRYLSDSSSYRDGSEVFLTLFIDIIPSEVT